MPGIVGVTTGLLVALLLGLYPSSGRAQVDTTGAPPDSLPVITLKPNFGLAALEVVGTNVFVWAYNRYIREGGTNPGFRVTPDSWWENIKNGYEWDDNNFTTNQFAHPFHGSLYYNAARSNGYGYWGSIPFSFAGSMMWEYFGEKHHPSINDLYSTAVGGIALGESLYRLSDLVLDNTAHGGERTWRELAALLFNPVRGFTRVVTGRAFKRYANPPDHHPGFMTTTFDAGLRTIAENRLWEADTTDVFLQFQFDYGDPFEKSIRKPFDFFNFGLQLNFNDVSTLGRVQAQGALWADDLAKTESSHTLISVFQHFDYLNNRAFEYGGQSLGAGFLSKFGSEHSTLYTQLHLNAILMGATKDDYESTSGRSYGYGPGFGFKFRAALNREGRDWVVLGHEQSLIQVLNGNPSNHLLTFSWVRLEIPTVGNIATGAEYILYTADRNYDDYDDVYQRSPQLRLFFSWLLGQ